VPAQRSKRDGPTAEPIKTSVTTAEKMTFSSLVRLEGNSHGKGSSRGRRADHLNSSVRKTRKYLTPAEVERLMAAARKSGRYGHRDATMILLAYRHGLCASESHLRPRFNLTRSPPSRVQAHTDQDCPRRCSRAQRCKQAR
jgi:hypothetical protein